MHVYGEEDYGAYTLLANFIAFDLRCLNCGFKHKEDGRRKNILKDEWESGLISNWTGRVVERYTGYVIIAFVIAWTTLSLWITLNA